MKLVILAVILFGGAATAFASDQVASNDAWIGIWHANVGALPTGTLTLAADTGDLGGTVVLDIIGEKDGAPHVIASEPHVLLHPQVSGSSLNFQVKMKKPDGEIATPSFTVILTAPNKATIHCVNCGPDAPVVELTKGL